MSAQDVGNLGRQYGSLVDLICALEVTYAQLNGRATQFRRDSLLCQSMDDWLTGVGEDQKNLYGIDSALKMIWRPEVRKGINYVIF